MANLLHAEIDYQITQTNLGKWKCYLYSNGGMYREFTSRAFFGKWPLLHVVSGRCPETGRIATARGVVAVGQKAWGIVAIGQAACGVIAIGQLAAGVLMGVGQAACGVVAIGQGAFGIFTIGQIAAGGWVKAQRGIGQDLWSLFRHH